jgi:hypothetical protein
VPRIVEDEGQCARSVAPQPQRHARQSARQGNSVGRGARLTGSPASGVAVPVRDNRQGAGLHERGE